MSNMIQVQVGDVMVLGEIAHRSAASLEIKIVSPYKNIGNGAYIFVMARNFMSFEGEYGDRRAEELLKEIFVFARFVEEDFQELKAYLDKLMESDLFTEICKLREGKKCWRKKLKSKGVDLRSIQLSHMKVAKKLFELEFEFKNKFQKFLDERASQKDGVLIKCDFVEDAIKILQGELDYI